MGLSVASNNIPGSRNDIPLTPTDYTIAKKQCLNQSKTRTASPSKRGTTSGLPCEAADTKATSKKSSQPKSNGSGVQKPPDWFHPGFWKQLHTTREQDASGPGLVKRVKGCN